MTKRVILHVGTPKTGTSYFQEVLHRNRVTLAEHGVLYPAERFDAHFLAALDLMRLPWGGLEQEAVGAWQTLVDQVREWPGTSIISHEVFAFASRTQIAKALADLGHPEVEVHLVLSARDLVRQIPAEWQENIKHRRTFTYARFLKAIADPRRRSRTGSWFWAVQELPDILDRWGADLSPERVHVVTVPRPGAPADLLWERFSTTFGLDDVPLDRGIDRTNASLGSPETALLRRINKAVNRVVPPAEYRPLVRELLAHRTLSQRANSPRLGLPPETYAWAADLARGWADELDKRGYDVVGDLEDLEPQPQLTRFADPDHPSEKLVNRAAVDAVRVLLEEAVRARQAEADLHADVRRLETEVRRLQSGEGRVHRIRATAVNHLERGTWGRTAMRAYRRARRRDAAAG